MKKGLKILVIFVASTLTVFILVLIFISPITKYLIEKYSVEYTGRQVKMDGLSINLFNGRITARGLRIYEAKSKDVFFGCDKLQANLAVYKVLASKYDITELSITKPVLHIRQDGARFNYDDLMARFLSDTTPPDPRAKPAKYWVRNLKADSVQIIYENRLPYVKLDIVHGSISLPLVAWDDPIYRIHGVMDLATGGHFTGDMVLNADTYDYQLSLDMEKLDIGWMYPYMRDYMKVKSLDGLIGSKMIISGNFDHPSVIAASGNLSAEKFSIVDETNEQLSAVQELTIKIDTLNTVKNMYNFSTVTINKPFIKLSVYENGFNYERIMTTPYDASGDSVSVSYANIFLMMAGYIQDIVKQYDVNNYKIGRLSITNGQCVFTDFSHGDKFRYVLDSLHMSSDRINSNNPQLVFNAHSRLNTSGKMRAVMKVDPKNYRDIDIDAQVSGLLMSDFNPYTKYYVATPFADGRITYTNRTIVLGGKLDSKNVLDIKKLKAGKKIKDVSTAINIPVRLAVSLLKDVDGNIHLDIPVKGSLDDPTFKWGKVVWGVVKNLMEKIVVAPFRWIAGLFGGKEEEYKDIRFEYMQGAIFPEQEKLLDRLAKVAVDKPDLAMELSQVTNKEDEAEYLALFEMKRQYLHLPSDSIITAEVKKRTDSVGNNDSLFIKFINARMPVVITLQSTQEKCVQILGNQWLMPRVHAVMEKRNRLVADYFLLKNLPAGAITVFNAQDTVKLQRSEQPRFIVSVTAKD